MFANTKPNTKSVNTTYLERNTFYCDIQYIQWTIQSLLYQNRKKEPIGA